MEEEYANLSAPIGEADEIYFSQTQVEDAQPAAMYEEETMIDKYEEDDGLENEELIVDDDEGEHLEESSHHDNLRKKSRGVEEDVEAAEEAQDDRPKLDPNVVVKKPSSKWMIFLNEQRKVLQETDPGLSVGDVTKVVAERYKALTNEDLERLEAILQEDKQRYQQYLELHPEMQSHGKQSSSKANNRAALSSLNSYTPSSSTQLIFPLARIKRIVKYDEEVKAVNKDALLLITKATELFVGRMAVKTASTTAQRGGRTIKLNDVLQTIHTNDFMDFLQMDFPKPMIEKKANKASSDSNSASSKAKAAPVANTKGSIKNFFGAGAAAPPSHTSIVGKRRGLDEDEDDVEHEAIDEN